MIGSLSLTRLLRAPSIFVLKISKDVEFTTFLGNLFQCFITFTVNKFYTISSLNLLSFSLRPLSLELVEESCRLANKKGAFFSCNIFYVIITVLEYLSDSILVVSVARKCVTALYKNFCRTTDLHLSILNLQSAIMTIQFDFWYIFSFFLTLLLNLPELVPASNL